MMHRKTNRKFIHDWIAENFYMSCITVTYMDDNTAIIKDRHGDTMLVEMRSNTLYADGRPYCSIPSLL